MSEVNIVKFIAEFYKQIFPKNPNEETNYRICAMNIDKEKNEDVYDELKFNKYGNVTLVGDLPELYEDVDYTIEAEEQVSKNKAFGYQYSVIRITRQKPTNKTQSKKFLTEILTYNQAETLLKVYPNIIDKIINNDLDDIDLSKTKGIKEKLFEKIKYKVIQNFCLMELIDKYTTEEGEQLLSFSVLKKLYNNYSSVEKIESAIKKYPYETLCNLSGIGFKTADKVILKLNSNMINDIQRTKSCIEYLLNENENNGNTYMNTKELHKEIGKLIPEATHHFVTVIKDNKDLYISSDKKVIANRKTYETELFISNKIKELLVKPNKWYIDCDKYIENDGVKLTEQQSFSLKNLCDNNISLLVGFGGCVDCDTEFFNGYEWKRIADYKEGDKVLQYNENGTTELVNPIQYHKYPSEYLTLMRNESNSINQVLSDEHNVVYLTSKGHLAKLPFYEVKRRHEENSHGFNGKFITYFNYNGEGIGLSDAEIRVMVAVIADGSFCCDANNRCRFHIKKERKKERLRYLFKQANISWKESQSSAEGYTDFYIYAPRKEKEFTSDWFKCTNHQLQIVIDEVLYWDGSIGRKGRQRFSTSIKNSADFVQFAFSACGYRATINTRDRSGESYFTCGKYYTRKSIEYTVQITQNQFSVTSIRSKEPTKKTQLKSYKTLDGYKYCFTVPSSMLVLRREDRIFITGNSGKTQTIQSLINMLDDNNKSYMLMASTGKASKILSSYTKKPATTIHRGLGFNPGKGWLYNHKNPLDVNVVIVDETSMVDIFLAKHLLDAIDVNRTKLVFVFDEAQIPSVSCGKFAYDMINSEVIPYTRLTKIFRYDEGGLYWVATETRNGNQFVESTYTGIKNFGNNKDYSLISVPQEKTIDYTLKLYQQLLNNGNTIDDIMVTMALNKGDYGTIEVNRKIQEIANTPSAHKKEIKLKINTFREQDKVMQIVNNYTAINSDYEEDTIFNGDTGTIIKIKGDEVFVDYRDKVIIYGRSDLDQLMLAYAVNIYKMQGSSAKNIILLTPKAHTYMLNRNLLYTGQTRAKQRVYHIGTPKTINIALKKSANYERCTFLKDMLMCGM